MTRWSWSMIPMRWDSSAPAGGERPSTTGSWTASISSRGRWARPWGARSGGYTSGRSELIDLLRQRSRPYLFSNSLAPPIVCASIKALELLMASTRAARSAGGEHPVLPPRNRRRGIRCAAGRAPDRANHALRRRAGRARPTPYCGGASTSSGSPIRSCRSARLASGPRFPPRTPGKTSLSPSSSSSTSASNCPDPTHVPTGVLLLNTLLTHPRSFAQCGSHSSSNSLSAWPSSSCSSPCLSSAVPQPAPATVPSSLSLSS